MKFLFIALATLALATVGTAEVKTFYLEAPGGKNFVQFTSKAPIENVTGVSNAISGSVAFDPNDLTKGVNGRISVDLRELKTGIDIRDQHMRGEQYLDVDNHPDALFEISTPLSVKLETGVPTEISFTGNFTVHGVTKKVAVTGKASYFGNVPELEKMGYSGEIFNFDGQFRIKLSDFGIQRPQFLVMKLAEEIDVFVNFTATTKN